MHVHMCVRVLRHRYEAGGNGSLENSCKYTLFWKRLANTCGSTAK